MQGHRHPDALADVGNVRTKDPRTSVNGEGPLLSDAPNCLARVPSGLCKCVQLRGFRLPYMSQESIPGLIDGADKFPVRGEAFIRVEDFGQFPEGSLNRS